MRQKSQKNRFFFAKHFLGAVLLFLNQFKKTDILILIPHSTNLKKKNFRLIEESMCTLTTFYDLKSQICKQPLSIS
jgi:hypothetical protein